MTYTHLSDAIPCRTHRSYRLNCEQYEGLIVESGGMCQICGFPADQMQQRKLYIDHFPWRWCVRGLLCRRCNSRIERGVPFDAASAAYLDNAWYLRQLANAGLPLEGGPEPDVAGVVDNFSRYWTRLRPDLWSAGDMRTRARDWQRMNRDFGPFNLIPITASGSACPRRGAAR